METFTLLLLENAKQRLGRNIRQRREQFGFTQERLAEMVDMSGTAIGMLERGLTWPEWDNLQKIANVLEIPELNFFAGDFEAPTPTPQDALKILSEFVKEHSK